MAAALKVSAAANRTFLPLFLFLAAILPIEVVLPTPLTPIISITFFSLSSSSSSESPSNIISAITSFKAGLTISTSFIFSFLILAFNLSIISTVVSIPISDIISASSSSSYISSSIVTAKFKASFILSVKLSLVFVNPVFNLSNNFPNIFCPPLFLQVY